MLEAAGSQLDNAQRGCAWRRTHLQSHLYCSVTSRLCIQSTLRPAASTSWSPLLHLESTQNCPSQLPSRAAPSLGLTWCSTQSPWAHISLSISGGGTITHKLGSKSPLNAKIACNKITPGKSFKTSHIHAAWFGRADPAKSLLCLWKVERYGVTLKEAS